MSQWKRRKIAYFTVYNLTVFTQEKKKGGSKILLFVNKSHQIRVKNYTSGNFDKTLLSVLDFT